MYLYNSPEYAETNFAAMKIGGVPINVNYRYLDDELHYLLENADIEALVFHSSLGDRVARVCDRRQAYIEEAAGQPTSQMIEHASKVRGIGEGGCKPGAHVSPRCFPPPGRAAGAVRGAQRTGGAGRGGGAGRRAEAAAVGRRRVDEPIEQQGVRCGNGYTDHLGARERPSKGWLRIRNVFSDGALPRRFRVSLRR